RNMSKSSGKKQEIQAVREVSLDAADGQITGLLGPNGAGKTTLLRMLATLLAPDAGSASIDGHNVVENKMQARRAMGVLSDARGLYQRLTARENIRYYGTLHGLSESELNTRSESLIRQLGLQDLADRRTQGY